VILIKFIKKIYKTLVFPIEMSLFVATATKKATATATNAVKAVHKYD
jgi:hypothetical protein